TRGWAEQARVKTASRIDVPRQGATVGVGVARFGGVAWAQHRGISRVEVQLDGGPWQEAVLGGVAGVDTWVQWSLTANLDAGDHVLVVRATDKLGRTQTGVRRDVVPDGATGWHTVEFTAS
ncbi:MAG TPA: oxidoreductase, partial [Marmoricola sp.]|nr:oxidoreductase [Marmoricola sp.]